MIIDGKKLGADIRQTVKQETATLSKNNIFPELTVVLVGSNPASQIYVRMKEKGCAEAGIKSVIINRPPDIKTSELLDIISELNSGNTSSILVQLPLPEHIDTDTVISAILPEKDVDGFHPVNMGNLLAGKDGIVSCTPLGILELIKSTNIDITGKHAVVIGRSNIVGKPIGLLLLRENCTVTYCHSRTIDLSRYTKEADIIIAAVGSPDLITVDMIKYGSILIDVGMNRVAADNEKGYIFKGDIDFNGCKDKAAFITPVPGGVGPMTIAMLLRNTLQLAKKAHGIY